MAVPFTTEPSGARLPSGKVTVLVRPRARARAGGRITLKPGESVTLTRGLYHRFWAEKKKVFIGEVSMVNDDRKDNSFLDQVGRFPDIEEDVPAEHLLITDY